MDVISVPIATLFKAQFLDGDFRRYECLFYYFIFRSIAEGNETQANYDKLLAKFRKCGWHIGSWKQVTGLMTQMETKGFLREGPIRVQENYWMGDGRHRFCCAMALDFDEVFIAVHSGGRKQYLGRSWFIENNFEPSLIKSLDLIKNKLMEKYGIHSL